MRPVPKLFHAVNSEAFLVIGEIVDHSWMFSSINHSCYMVLRTVTHISSTTSTLCHNNIHKIHCFPTRFVKTAPYGMAIILTKLINISIVTFTFPDLWIVTPVQRSTKQNTSLSNFQPIFILPVVSKILEWYSLLSTRWSGFRPGNSTQDVLLCVTNLWLKVIDNGKYVGAMIMESMLVQCFLI